MKRWLASCGLVLGLSALVPPAYAQIPGIPGGIAAPPAALPGIPGAAGIPAGVPAAVPAAPRTLWNFLGISKAGCQAHKEKFCQSQLGTLVNNGMMPFSSLTGGILPGCCPTSPTPAQLAADEAAGGAQGVASQIKADEAKAKARIAAIEYLATVDCTYWPDAAPALINGLRNDRNECVRFAAARALGSGCCCNEKTIAALTLTVNSATTDGAPPENSPRVKAAAFAALQHCEMKVPNRPRQPRERPNVRERPESPAGFNGTEGGSIKLATYYDDLDPERVISDARRAVRLAASAPAGDTILTTGSRSVAHAFVKASQTTSAPRLSPTPPTSSAPSATAPAPRIDLEVVPSAYRPSPTASTSAASSGVATGQRSLFGIFSASRKARNNS